MKRIRLLDKKVYDKIAAGEIVESPVSVVKELLENSLDAGASLIEISIENAGMSVIRVTDNGAGIHPDDLEKAFVSHATSKIRTEEDLEKVDSFGFRGEALASISAVSEVELASRTSDMDAASGIRLFEGTARESFEAPMVTGTKIEVRNLFFNLPARKKFITNMNTEATKIADLVSRYAAGHYDLDFILKKDRQIVLDTRGHRGLTERMKYILNKKKDDFFHIREQESLYTLEAVLCSPHLSRNTKKNQIFFVNGRLIKSSLLHRILDEVYDTFMPKGRFPEAVIWLRLDPLLLDVNIHPAKTEIRFLNEAQLRLLLTAVLRQKLLEGIQKKEQYSDIAIVPEKAFKTEEPSEKKEVSFRAQRLGFSYQVAEGAAPSSAENLQMEAELPAEPVMPNPESRGILQESPALKHRERFESVKTEPGEYLESAEAEPYECFESAESETDKHPESTEKRHVKSNYGDLRIIGQFKQTFILAEDESHLYIIDQHVVHERILFERYSRQADQGEVIKETLLHPVALELNAREEGCIISHIVTLNNLGFEVESFGNRTYLLRTIPAGFEMNHPQQFFMDLLEDLEAFPAQSVSKVREAIISSAACKASVKASQRLRPEQITFLLQELDQTQNPFTCPHGRPIMKKISMGELYKYFQRGAWNEE